MKKINKKTRPAVLVRFYPTDLARLSQVCADTCTPRENFCRQAILRAVDARLTAPAIAADIHLPGALDIQKPSASRIAKRISTRTLAIKKARR